VLFCIIFWTSVNRQMLYFWLVFVTFLTTASAQSPHGPRLTMDCAKCHSPESWNFKGTLSSFSHDSTAFPLTGQHKDLDCRSCHGSLVFEQAATECISCHNDVHKQSVGTDCARCHTPQSWVVENITQLHEETAFPLMGVHSFTDCNACHQDETNLRFNVAGVDCMSCHREDFKNTRSPDHIKLNFSEDCASCHSLTGAEWNTDQVDHSFFPLEKGHALNSCTACHAVAEWSGLSANCYSCHAAQYNEAKMPDHKAAGFSKQCTECHTLDPGWQPAEFTAHDGQFFPIYSGSHKGVWNNCSECHNNASDYNEFTCIGCHTNPDTDNIHEGIGGYTYDNISCLGCHPTGSGDNAFNHNATSFPLTGAHINTACIACHANGFEGTSTVCADCHTADYTASLNPDHNKLGISTDCASCHSTAAGWSPASFALHDQFYPLNGAHKLVASQCVSCHNGDYNNTPNTCAGCHSGDFASAKNPDHVLNQFSNDCTSCHDETAWRPSTFSHDIQYFPIYTGKHAETWDQCTDCHQIAGNFTQFSCTNCHTDPVTSDVHAAVPGYVFQDNACLACHPTGDADVLFDHNTTAFPLTGAHQSATCLECHSAGFEGTPTECVACHNQDRNNAINPNHTALALGDDCVKCHTTQPGWAPASFPDHNNFYALNGAHQLIADQCVSCHNGDYNNTQTSCFGCHQDDYSATMQPDHEATGISTDCANCHSESAWAPSTFQHDALYFPIFSGAHKDQWNNCTECHQTPGNYMQFTCIGCHLNPETNNDHADVPGYFYSSDACLACHPSGDTDNIFDHNTTNFPLTGAHLSTACLECHASGFAGTPTGCVACHQADYAASQNPNHSTLQLSTDCAGCHTTTPGWTPATFAVHNDYYPLNGAHAAISNQCAACHQGNYNNTPNTCVGCHQGDYNATTDPNHIQLQFPDQCASCHSENAWTPSTFNHDNQYFPIYSGAHQGEWNQCMDCHTNPGNYAIFTCVTCHTNPETNEDHEGVGGYIYESTACLACHPTGDADVIFDHNTTGFLLTEGHSGVDCISCHANGFQGTPTDCNSCHMNDFNQASNPNHMDLGLSTDCISCHTTVPGWAPASFEVHNQYYVLEGAHALISSNCIDCHNNNYNNTPNTCVGCHQDAFNGTTDPDHELAQYPTDCTLCHNQTLWSPASFNHDVFYPLTGGHAAVASNCILCHTSGYNNTPNTCSGCHQDDYAGSGNPNHTALGLPTDCQTCHTTAPGWAPAEMPNHDVFYLIEGAHLAIANDCAACHNGNYNNTPNTCVGCHLETFNATTSPDHETNQFPTECASCHSQNAWMPSTFDHNQIYPLTGAHASIANECTACHINGDFINTPNTCIGCHQSDFSATSDPDHEAQQYPEDCTLCHNQTSWMPATFNHNDFYPLTGGHQVIEQQCVLCHQGNYNNTPATCVGCHQSDYNNSVNPNHTTLNLSTDCVSCHTTAPGWAPAQFPDHNNYYTIQGAHSSLNCVDCHNGNYNNTPNTCYGCHQNDYSAALMPNHTVNQYPTDCTTCHNQTAWSPSIFDHNTFYPLTGGHLPIANDCNQCHNGSYNNTPNTCVGCHQSNYNGATNPNHLNLSLSTDCVSCHTTAPGWSPALFPDHGNYWVITGAHTALDCVDCHNGNYNNTPNTCYGCHQGDYNNTADPDHEAAQFPTDCTVCHDQNAWMPSTFDHDGLYFPIYSGKHDGEWNACSDCHTNPNNYSIFSCLGCHPHNNQAETNSQHNGVNGYQYLSSACYACHPDGQD
jgi:hypothetical protein